MRVKDLRFKNLFLVFLIVIPFYFLLEIGNWKLEIASASHCPSGDYDCQISEIQREIDAIAGAHETNKQELSKLNTQLADVKKRITGISIQLKKLEGDIVKREEDLAYTKALFEEKTENHYILIRTYNPILFFLSSTSAANVFREIALRQKAVEGDRQEIEKYALELTKLKTDKQVLETNKSSLSALEKKVDEQAKFLGAEVAKTEKYISSLTSRQNELIAAKSGGFQTSVGDTPPTLVPCSGAPGSANFCDPGFRPAFAGFSFGAPHRTGMSQYGAYGRAKLGQNAETILSSYYQGSELKKDYQSPDTIGVSGFGRISLEDNYLLGIYEVPESWGDNGGFEALKAQAVAARTYGLSVTNNGAGSICTTEACQVYKPQLKSGKWAEAVRATRGWVLIKGGGLAKTYYASTSGGFTISQWGWEGIKDTSGDWPGTAYEKVGASPWFYMGWYKSRAGSSCGRGNPWLTSNEMADILNAWQVLYKGGGDVSRISPLDTSCWSGSPYSKAELASIGGFTDVSSVSVVYSNSGLTLNVTFSTNKGSTSVAGEELKKAFNLRAPGYIGLKSSLFNIEKL
ncbi:MAG: SpoIID/LytB domain-containing protein [Patescibacteria group bacterium]